MRRATFKWPTPYFMMMLNVNTSDESPLGGRVQRTAGSLRIVRAHEAVSVALSADMAHISL